MKAKTPEQIQAEKELGYIPLYLTEEWDRMCEKVEREVRADPNWKGGSNQADNFGVDRLPPLPKRPRSEMPEYVQRALAVLDEMDKKGQ